MYKGLERFEIVKKLFHNLQTINADDKTEKKSLIRELYDFYNFICEHNPLILDYGYNNSEKQDKEEQLVTEPEPEQKTAEEIRFEDKYLARFKAFPNEYVFTDTELEEEKTEFERLKKLETDNLFNTIKGLKEKLVKIQMIDNSKSLEDDLSDDCKYLLLEYFFLDEEDVDDFNELVLKIALEKSEVENELQTLENKVIDDSSLLVKAREFIINKKLDHNINNYVLEPTPLGNVYMRYNNDKKSFEYFSNNSIPYRYLEPVGRKYVITYWCKPLFVDLEEELKLAEEKYDEEIKRREEEEKRKKEDLSKNPQKDVLVRLKTYNKENTTKIQPSVKMQMKNRNQTAFVLPPQIKANLPNVNQSSNKQLLKENANRYTWEGRLTNFSPLKKIDKKIINKKLALTFADFKRIQQEGSK